MFGSTTWRQNESHEEKLVKTYQSTKVEKLLVKCDSNMAQWENQLGICHLLFISDAEATGSSSSTDVCRKTSRQLSNYFPLLRTKSIALNINHRKVLKDFIIFCDTKS